MSSAISQLLGIQTTPVVMFTTESSYYPPPPANSNFESNRFFSQTHVSGGVIKHILVCIIGVTFNLDAFRNYL